MLTSKRPTVHLSGAGIPTPCISDQDTNVGIIPTAGMALPMMSLWPILYETLWRLDGVSGGCQRLTGL